MPILAVVYDPDHSTHSDMEYGLSAFTSWEKTKRLIATNFVPMVGALTDPDLRPLGKRTP